jgi:hypothetical protein
MAAITDYNSLIQALKDVAEDDGAEFSEYIVIAIDLAEERLFNELELSDLSTKFTGGLTGNSTTLNKPDDYTIGIHLSVTVAGDKKFLKRKTEDFIVDYWPNPANTGVPKYYCDSDQTTFLIAPTPNASYAYEIKYLAKPTKLSINDQENFYTKNVKDVLYAACMVEMCKFMKAWDQIEVWEITYQTLKNNWNIRAKRQDRDNLVVSNHPSGGPNTIRHTENTVT